MIKVRKAKIEDLTKIKKIDDFGKQLNSYSILDHIKTNLKLKKGVMGYHERFIRGKKKWALVAEDNGKIVGFILFLIKKRAYYWKINKLAYLDLLIRDKNYRKKGAGRLLVKEMYKILKNEDVEYVQLSTHPQNPAQKFWENLGFRTHRLDMFRKF